MPKGKGSRCGARVFHRRTPYAATDDHGFLKTVDDCINSSSSAAGATHSHESVMMMSLESPVDTKDEQILEQNGIDDLKSMGMKAAEELSKRPKRGQIYAAVKADVGVINARLKHLSVSLAGASCSIDEGLEIADAASLLKLLDKSTREIDVAGQMAQRGALLMLQAQMLLKRGQELLDQSKRKLQSVDIMSEK